MTNTDSPNITTTTTTTKAAIDIAIGDRLIQGTVRLFQMFGEEQRVRLTCVGRDGVEKVLLPREWETLEVYP